MSFVYHKGSKEDFVGAPDWARSLIRISFSDSVRADYWSASSNLRPEPDDRVRHMDRISLQEFKATERLTGDFIECLAVRVYEEYSFDVGDIVVLSENVRFESDAEVLAGEQVEILRKKLVGPSNSNIYRYAVYNERLDDVSMVDINHGSGRGIQFINQVDTTKYAVDKLVKVLVDYMDDDYSTALASILIHKGFIKESV